jgi:hypothetical protein
MTILTITVQPMNNGQTALGTRMEPSLFNSQILVPCSCYELMKLIQNSLCLLVVLVVYFCDTELVKLKRSSNFANHFSKSLT